MEETGKLAFPRQSGLLLHPTSLPGPGVGDLGEQFVAAGADQAAILATTRTVAGIISAHFAAGQLTIGLAFLAVGSAALATSWVPRSIGWLLTLPALTTFVLLAATVVLDVFLFPIVLLHVALLVVAGLMIARQWWSAPATSAREGATGA